MPKKKEAQHTTGPFVKRGWSIYGPLDPWTKKNTNPGRPLLCVFPADNANRERDIEFVLEVLNRDGGFSEVQEPDPADE